MRFLSALTLSLAMLVVLSLASRWVAARDLPAVPPSAQLDGLRAEAAGGDLDAARQLSGMLLGRYDREHRNDDLFEAMLWIDRDWNTAEFQSARLTTRVVEQYCDHPVLRWHWLCAAGE